MSNIKKRQHYVWRHYLRAWTNDESIWTYFKGLNKIERPGLMKVAQEKYFYKLADFTSEEEVYLKSFIERLSTTEELKGFNLEFFSMFTVTNRLKKQLAATQKTFLNKDLIAEEIRKMEINIMEDAHCKMEELGAKLIHYKSLDELKTILQDDYIYDAMMFLCIQYFRTKNMKKVALENFTGSVYEHLIEKSWNILSYVMGTTLTRGISLHPDLKFIFLENSTSNHFITGDQPVFNILNDQLNEKGEVKELELYYPLTPNHALIIHFRTTQTEQFERQDATDDQIIFLNNKVFENSDFYVFADTKEQLENSGSYDAKGRNSKQFNYGEYVSVTPKIRYNEHTYNGKN